MRMLAFHNLTTALFTVEAKLYTAMNGMTTVGMSVPVESTSSLHGMRRNNITNSGRLPRQRSDMNEIENIKECTCKEVPEFVSNSWHTEGCPLHCSHPGINTDGEWWCSCGASHEFPYPGGKVGE